MDENKKTVKKRKPRTLSPEKQIAIIDKKISRAQADANKKIAKIQADADKKIAELQAEKEALMKPIKAKQVIDEAIKNMSPEEIAEKLGVSLD